MKDLTPIIQRINEMEEKIHPLQQAKNLLQQELEHAQSLNFIEVNRITLDDVQMSNEKGMPYHFNINDFAAWLRYHRGNKFWAEWNGTIFSIDEIISGKMTLNRPGKVRHLFTKT